MSEQPSRSILVPAALLTQLAGATCILLGTVAFAVTFTNGDRALAPILGGWIVASLSAVVCGGLIYRGNLPSLVIAALLDGVFGVVLLQLSRTLGGLLHMLAPDDIKLVATVILVIAVVLLVAGLGCLAAIPQARRYATWFAHELDGGGDGPSSAASTARGFPPPPVPVFRGQPTLRIQVAQGKRRLWFAVVGLAVGVGSGVAVLTTSASSASSSSATAKPAPPPKPPAAGSGSPAIITTGSTGRGSAGVTKVEPKVTEPALVLATPQDLLVAEHAAIGRGDVAALAALAAPSAFAFGVDADEVADGRAAIEVVLRRDLGDPPKDGFGVDGKYLQLGEWRDHAWIAEELEVSGSTTRRYSITQLAARINGQWTIIAWHWALAVADAVAERHARAKTLPTLGIVPDRHDGSDELDAAVHATFGSREGFADGFSDRPDAVNFGSAGEHLTNGAMIRRLFGKIKANLKLVGGALVVAGNVWDKSQASGAWIAYSAMNVEFAPAGHPLQTFRVLAVLLRDGDTWKTVQTQFSNGGRIH